MSSRIHIHPSGLGAPHVKKAERDALERDYQAWLAEGNRPEYVAPGRSGEAENYKEKNKNIARAAKARKAKI